MCMAVAEVSVSSSGWALLALTRFCLASVVALGHLSWFVPHLGQPLNAIGSLSGKLAVVCFFMISGYSVGYSLLSKTEGYFQRRFLRIYPLYSVAVLFALLLVHLLGPTVSYPGVAFSAPGLKTHMANLLFLQNFIAITVVYNSPLWTLSVEVCLYILLPFLIRLPEAGLQTLAALSMVIFAMPSLSEAIPGGGALGGYVVFQYGWAFFLGLLLLSFKRSWGTLALLGLGAVLVAVNPLTAHSLSIPMYLAVIAILLFARWIELPGFVQVWLSALGEASYPLYLFHLPLYMALYSFGGVRQPWVFVICTLASVVTINWTFDRWLKDHFWRPVVSWIASTLQGRAYPTPSIK